jgi:hypothetical protein
MIDLILELFLSFTQQLPSIIPFFIFNEPTPIEPQSALQHKAEKDDV